MKYAGSGVVNTAVGVATIAMFSAVGVPPGWANAAGFAVGLVCSFVINGRFTFGQQKLEAQHAVRFIVAFVASYAANLMVLLLLLHRWQAGVVFAQLAAIAVYSVSMFLLMNHFVFRDRARA
jgi:putative flippase GtrA